MKDLYVASASCPQEPISDEKLAEIRAGLKGLPEGPWSYRDQPHDDWGMVRGKRDADGLASFVMQAKSGFPSEDELAEHRRAGTDPWGAFAKHFARLDPQTVSALLARLDKAEAQLRRISRWERYGGEDSEPLVYPKDIALAYFAPSSPKGS